MLHRQTITLPCVPWFVLCCTCCTCWNTCTLESPGCRQGVSHIGQQGVGLARGSWAALGLDCSCITAALYALQQTSV